jgi:hypothetical protein
LSKNENLVSHAAVGEDTNRGDPPWQVSPPATFYTIFILYEIPEIIFRQLLTPFQITFTGNTTSCSLLQLPQNCTPLRTTGLAFVRFITIAYSKLFL